MNVNVRWPTQHEWAVLGTHAIVAAGGGIATAAFFGVLDPQQVQDATADVKRIASDVSDLVGAIAGLVTIGTAGFATLRAGPIGSFFRAAATIAGNQKFTEQAKAALAQGNEPLAREALGRREAIAAQLQDLDTQHATIVEQEDKLTQTAQRLQTEVEAFRALTGGGPGDAPVAGGA